MSQPPFDQDQPPPRRRPSADAGQGRARRGPDGSRTSSGAKGTDPRNRSGRSGQPARPGQKATKSEGLPKWALPAGGAVLVLILLVVVLRACSSNGSAKDSGACLSDLAQRLPATAVSIAGTDLVQARANGYDDSDSLDVLAESKAATGTIPDAVTTVFRVSGLATKERFEAETGVVASEIDCSLSDASVAALSGSFDPPRVNGSEAGSKGRLAAEESLLVMANTSKPAASLLKAPKDEGLAANEAVLEVIESLRDSGAYSIIVQRGDGKNGQALAAGVGVGGSDGERTVELAWRFGSEADAKEGRPDIIERANSSLRGSVSIRNSELVIDGMLVTTVVPAPTAPDLQDLFSDPTFRLVARPKS